MPAAGRGQSSRRHNVAARLRRAVRGAPADSWRRRPEDGSIGPWGRGASPASRPRWPWPSRCRRRRPDRVRRARPARSTSACQRAGGATPAGPGVDAGARRARPPPGPSAGRPRPAAERPAARDGPGAGRRPRRRAALAAGAAPRGRRERLGVAEPPDAVPERRRRPDAHRPRRPGGGHARDALRAAAGQRGRLRRLRRRDGCASSRGRARAAAARAVAWPGWRSGSATGASPSSTACRPTRGGSRSGRGPSASSPPPGRRPDPRRARYRRGST